MALFKNIRQYRRSLDTRLKRYRKTADAQGAKASFFLANRLKSTAPIKSGQLVRSVRRRKLKTGYSVIAGYNSADGFNVGKWVNQEFSVTPQLEGGKASRFLKTPVGTPVRYGRGAPFKATAKVFPWFDKNVRKTIRRYRASYKQVRASLRT